MPYNGKAVSRLPELITRLRNQFDTIVSITNDFVRQDGIIHRLAILRNNRNPEATVVGNHVAHYRWYFYRRFCQGDLATYQVIAAVNDRNTITTIIIDNVGLDLLRVTSYRANTIATIAIDFVTGT